MIKFVRGMLHAIKAATASRGDKQRRWCKPPSPAETEEAWARLQYLEPSLDHLPRTYTVGPSFCYMTTMLMAPFIMGSAPQKVACISAAPAQVLQA